MPGKKAIRLVKQVDSCPNTPICIKKNIEKIEKKAEKIHLVSPSPNKDVEDKPKIDLEAIPGTKLFSNDGEDNESVVEVKKRIQVPSNASTVYKIINKATGCLGGNGYNGAIYGELTIGSMQKVINVFNERCGMTRRSRFIDVGAGLGKPNFHAAQDPQCRVSLGIELEDIRWQVS
jgi:hypothetical protein